MKNPDIPCSVVEFPLDKPDNTYAFTGEGIVKTLTRKISIVEFYTFSGADNDYLELLLKRGDREGTFIKRFPTWRLVECKADNFGSVIYPKFEKKDEKWISSLELIAMSIYRNLK